MTLVPVRYAEGRVVQFGVDVSAATAEGIVAPTIYRLTASKAYAYVTLESDVVAAGELERVETSHQRLGLGVLFPLPEYRWIRRAAVLVCYHILVLQVVLHGLGDAVARESTINRGRLDLHLQHQVVTNLGGIDLISVLRNYLHHAHRWRAGISDCSSGRQHGDVEAKSNVLFSRLVYALDVICLCFVSHQLRMFLYDEDEAGLSVDVYQSATAERNLERFCLVCGLGW